MADLTEPLMPDDATFMAILDDAPTQAEAAARMGSYLVGTALANLTGPLRHIGISMALGGEIQRRVDAFERRANIHLEVLAGRRRKTEVLA